MPSWIARSSKNQNHGLELLSQVGLLERAFFSTKLLSGGEKQRVAIARALCNHPKLILADEPSGNLDQKSAQLLGEILFSLVKKQNKSLILVTHDKTLADQCDQCYCLTNGMLVSL
jgi:lipoprotein-releasing system ATP-binding protein